MNQTANYKLSIVVPVYNEQASMHRVEQELAAYLNIAVVPACVLFVNDGSTDKSLEFIQEICERQTAFFYIGLQQNNGLSSALKAGIDTVQSEWMGYMDADLQTTPEDFNQLLQHADQYEMVIGIRVGRKDSFVKKASSRIANGYRRLMINDGIEDTGCPLKIIRTANARQIPFFNGMHRFLPALVQLQKATVKQVPVRHFPRLEGRSKYHLFNRLVGPFFDCFAFRWMKKRYINYQIELKNVE